jgi:hypothetical protein
LGAVNDGIGEGEEESGAGLLLSLAVRSPLAGCGGAQLTGCGKGPGVELAGRTCRVEKTSEIIGTDVGRAEMPPNPSRPYGIGGGAEGDVRLVTAARRANNSPIWHCRP